ncbi:MAG: hypothetical protein ACOVP8_01730, partial [Phycisphaerales bacterium]
TGSCAGDTTIAICDATFDTKMALYSGCGGTLITCNDDTAGCGTNGLGSTLNFSAAANTTYLVRLGGFQAATGTGNLVVNSCIYKGGPSC